MYIHVHSTVGIVCLGRDDKESVGEWGVYQGLPYFLNFLVLTKQISAKASILGSKGAHTEDVCMFAAASESKGMLFIFPWKFFINWSIHFPRLFVAMWFGAMCTGIQVKHN